MATNSYGLNNQTFNSVTVYKGKLGDIPIVSWDFISKCVGEQCGIYERCRYAQGEGLQTFEKKYSNVLEKYCTTQKRYVDQVFKSLIYSNRDSLTIEDSIRLGLMVMPLFGHLIKLKIAEAGIDQVISYHKEKLVINPVYKEIRETIKGIDSIMMNLGLERPELPDKDDFVNGDPNYYDRMMDNEVGEESNNEQDQNSNEETESSFSGQEEESTNGKRLRK
jgi:hypothetical protein